MVLETLGTESHTSCFRFGEDGYVETTRQIVGATRQIAEGLPLMGHGGQSKRSERVALNKLVNSSKGDQPNNQSFLQCQFSDRTSKRNLTLHVYITLHMPLYTLTYIVLSTYYRLLTLHTYGT